jgi:hypothetical protein
LDIGCQPVVANRQLAARKPVQTQRILCVTAVELEMQNIQELAVVLVKVEHAKHDFRLASRR